MWKLQALVTTANYGSVMLTHELMVKSKSPLIPLLKTWSATVYDIGVTLHLKPIALVYKRLLGDLLQSHW